MSPHRPPPCKTKKSLKCRRKKFPVFIRKKEYEKSCSRWFRCVLRSEEEFHLQWDEKNPFEYETNWRVEKVTARATEKGFFRVQPNKKCSVLCVQSESLSWRTQKPEELNCVYKSDNCWETKSFTVEFLTLYFFSLFCCSSRTKVAFLFFSHRFSAESIFLTKVSFLLWHDARNREE